MFSNSNARKQLNNQTLNCVIGRVLNEPTIDFQHLTIHLLVLTKLHKSDRRQAQSLKQFWSNPCSLQLRVSQHPLVYLGYSVRPLIARRGQWSHDQSTISKNEQLAMRVDFLAVIYAGSFIFLRGLPWKLMSYCLSDVSLQLFHLYLTLDSHLSRLHGNASHLHYIQLQYAYCLTFFFFQITDLSCLLGYSVIKKNMHVWFLTNKYT